MTKLIFAVLVIIAITTIIGTSIISADAAGKPTTLGPFIDDGVLVVGSVCGYDNVTVNIHYETFITTWPDNNKVKTVITSTGDAFNSVHEIIGKFKGKETFDGFTDDHGVDRYLLRQSIHCVDGGEDNFNTIKTITH